MADKRIVFATGNAGKMKEIREILSDLELEVVSMKEIGIEMPIEEDGTTFEENALIKARAVARQCGEIVLADDSGLEVDYLNEKYDLNLPEDEEYETLAGLILYYNEDIPEEGEQIEIENIVFEVLSVKSARIEEVKIKI